MGVGVQSFEALTAEDPVRLGPYELVGRLGAGGMGRVYLGRSRGGRTVAVKVVHAELSDDETFRRRFAREVNAARRVNGAFTATVVDADPEGTPAWLATAYVPGMSLAQAVGTHGAWPVAPVTALGAGLAEALEAIHAAGVIHRDLKPSNVLLAADGPRVIDFGIAVAAETTALTRTGHVVGTPGFMSPEQVTGAAADPAGDVFSLGAVLAYAASGIGPFGTGPAPALNYRVVYEQPDLAALQPALRRVVARCLAKNPAERPVVPELFRLLTGAAPPTGPGWLPAPVADSLLSPPGAPRDRPPATAPTRPLTGLVPTPDAPQAPQRRTLEEGSRTGTTERRNVPDGVTDRKPSGRTADEPTRQGPGPGARREPEPGGTPERPPEGETDTGDAWEPSGTTVRGPSRRNALIRLGLVGAAGTVGFGAWRALRDPVNSGATWRVSLDRDTLSRPAVVGGTLCLSTSKYTVRALDAATGEERWTLPGPGGVAGFAASPAADVLYMTGGNGRLVAVDIADGGIRWSTGISGFFRGLLAPAAEGSKVYAATDKGLVAVDASTGERLWRARNGTSASGPLVADGVVYTAGWAGSDGGGHRLYAVDARTGATRWDFPAEGDAAFATPAVRDGLVCVADSESRLYALDAATGRVRWTARRGTGDESPALLDGTVLFGDGTELVALDAVDGTRRWSHAVGGGPVRGTVAAADGLVHVSGSERFSVVDVATGARRAAFSVPAGETGSVPVVGDGLVYVWFLRDLYAFPVPGPRGG